jgi:hypothetical protein
VIRSCRMRRTRRMWCLPAPYARTTGRASGWTLVPVIPSWIRSLRRSPSGDGTASTWNRSRANTSGSVRHGRRIRICGSRSVRRPGTGRCSSNRLRSGSGRAPMLRSTAAPSTMVPEIAERYRADGQEFTPIEVPIWTLAQVAAAYVPGPVDFLKVDVEGFEREVLAGADWGSFRPRIVVMEATVPKSDEPAYEAWEPTLLDAGYRLALFDGLNRFYAHADEPALLQTLAIPANVFDDFVPYAWTLQVDQAQRWAHSLEESLTYAQQERDQLYESEARAGATARGAQAQAAIADESAARALAEAHRVRTELHALRATRTFRYTAPLRNIYTTLRRRPSGAAPRRSPINRRG